MSHIENHRFSISQILYKSELGIKYEEELESGKIAICPKQDSSTLTLIMIGINLCNRIRKLDEAWADLALWMSARPSDLESLNQSAEFFIDKGILSRIHDVLVL